MKDLLFMVLFFTIPTIIGMFLWKKAKTSETFGVHFVSFIVAIIGTVIKANYIKSTMDALIYFIMYWFITVMIIFFSNYIINDAIKEGKKEFNKVKADYINLKEKIKNNEELTDLEKRRFKYLEKNGYKYNYDFEYEKLLNDEEKKKGIL